jgi:hypothetical protein
MKAGRLHFTVQDRHVWRWVPAGIAIYDDIGQSCRIDINGELTRAAPYRNSDAGSRMITTLEMAMPAGIAINDDPEAPTKKAMGSGSHRQKR